MDPSQIFVAILTAVTVGLLAWVEIRSRLNQERENPAPGPSSASEKSR